VRLIEKLRVSYFLQGSREESSILELLPNTGGENVIANVVKKKREDLTSPALTPE